MSVSVKCDMPRSKMVRANEGDEEQMMMEVSNR